MNKIPFFTIVTPTYNRAYIIGKTIKSVLNQTFSDFEYIIVDDGSTDNTEKVVKSFCDRRIIYLKLLQNSGGSCKPRNVGFKHAKGEYIVRVDSDVKLDKNALQVFREWISKKPEIGIFFLDVISEEDKKLKTRSRKETVNPNQGLEFTYKDQICNPRTKDHLPCLKKKVTEEAKLPENFRNYAFYYKIARKWNFFYIPKIGLYVSSQRPGGSDRIMATIEENASKFIEGIDDYLKNFRQDTLKLCPRKMEGWLRNRGVMCILDDRKKEGIECFLKGLRYKFFSYKSWIYLILSIVCPILIKWNIRRRK